MDQLQAEQLAVSRYTHRGVDTVTHEQLKSCKRLNSEINLKSHLYIILKITKQICKTRFSHYISRETLFLASTLVILLANHPFSPANLKEKETKNAIPSHSSRSLLRIGVIMICLALS